MGRAAGRNGVGGRTRAVALLLAGATLALGLSAVVAVYAAYDGIQIRSAHRALVPQAMEPSSKPLAVAYATDDEVDGLQYGLIYIRPRAPGVPPPPGMDHWPAPGEAVLSPALVRALNSDGTGGRYGRVIAAIRSEGLASPGERFGYVNPRDDQFNAHSMRPIVAIGGRGAPAGDLEFIKDRASLVQALYLVLLPAGVLAVVAVRMGSVGRDRRTALVAALGGGRRARVWLNLGESAVPVVAGALLGALPGALIAVTGDTQLPWIGYELSAADLRRWWPQLALAPVAAATALLLLVCLTHRAGGRRRPVSARLASRGARTVRYAGIAAPFLLVATIVGPARLDPAQYHELRGQLYHAGVVAVLLTLPCAVALCAAASGRVLARSARRTSSAGAVIAGRHMAAHPGVTARLVAGIGIALVVVSQVQPASLQFGSTAYETQGFVREVGRQVMVVRTTEGLPPDRLLTALAHLPAPAALLTATESKGAPGTVLVRGSCAALTAVRLPCGTAVTPRPVAGADARLLSALWWAPPLTATRLAVQERSALPDPGALAATKLILVSRTGGDLPEKSISRLLRDCVPTLSATAEVPGDGWTQGANLQRAHGRWVVFLGFVGVFVLGVAVTLANLAEFLRFSRAVAPLSVLTGNRRVYYATAAWALLAPLLAAIAVSVLVASWLASPQEQPALGIEVSSPMLAAGAAVLGALSVFTWYCGARAAAAQSGRWRPYGE
ncbi:hypothetical protein ACGFW5_15270 [Streptomyces sp. NPDC048416]|uniref:hypothetical protein n=1 Tax=Streptomyces sp. NPDC048416 TaxID=3365546 RepID=UPI00371A433F